jgi:uncharacterized delta-60 repeat protein
MGFAHVRSASLATATAVVLLVATPAGATAGRTAPGHLDPTFGTGGKVVLSLGKTGAFNAVLALPSGKLLAAGYLGNKVLLMRFSPTGHRDTSFGGGDGMVTTAFPGYSVGADFVGVTPTGRLLVGGGASLLSDPDQSGVALVRYMPNGALDTSFGGGDGRVRSDVNGGPDIFEAMTLGGGGRPVVALESGGQPFVPTVVRYTKSGSLDHTFSGDGKASLPSTGSPFIEAVAVLASGRVVVAGEAAPSADEDFVLYRLTDAGGLDSTFGSGGTRLTDFAGGSDVADALAVDSTGRIVAGGQADVGVPGEFAAARYTKAGNLDHTFSGDGKVTTALGPKYDRIFALAIAPSGKILAGGRTNTAGGDEQWGLVRYLAGGGLDTGFGTGGIAITNMIGPTGNGESIEGLAVEPGGRIVAAGYAGNHPALAGYAG